MDRRIWIAAASLAAVGACDCPDKRTVTYTSTTCDEATRMCTTEDVTEDLCPCPEEIAHLCQYQGRPTCSGSISGVGEWVANQPTEDRHVIDGRFTGSEWDGTTRLEGLFTDVYMDYRNGRLYFLNDWRANDEGIRPDCFNYFQIRMGLEWIDLKVYGDGHVVVTRDGVDVSENAQGAYGFEPSPRRPDPHTIYEFSLAAEAGLIDVCCFDPLTESSCDELAHEPMVVSIDATGSAPRVQRNVPEGSVPRLDEDAPCGDGQGICKDGLSCVPVADGYACVAPEPAVLPPFDPPD